MFFKLGKKKEEKEEEVATTTATKTAKTKVAKAKASDSDDAGATGASESKAPASPKKKDAVIKEKVSTKSHLMDSMLEATVTLPVAGDLVEGKVIAIDKTGVYIDLPPYGTGIIYGKEYISARDIIKKINIGDNVAAKVVSSENENGYVELSL